MSEAKQQLIEKYQGLLLGKPCYESEHRWRVSEFADPDELIYFLIEMDASEAVLTPEGLKFLKEYYGLDRVINLLLKNFKNSNTRLKYKSNKDLIDWFERLGY